MINKLFLPLLLTSGISFADTPGQSKYTSVLVEDCITITSSDNEENPDIDYYSGECTGFGGFRPFVAGGDLRYSLGLIYQDTVIDLEKMPSFHDMGSPNIEWRYNLKPNSVINFYGLIYRINFSDWDDETGMNIETSKLAVVRLNGKDSCVIGTVEKSDNMNEKARLIVDNLELPCLY